MHLYYLIFDAPFRRGRPILDATIRLGPIAAIPIFDGPIRRGAPIRLGAPILEAPIRLGEPIRLEGPILVHLSV